MIGALPIQTERELDRPALVGLITQVLNSGGGVGNRVVRMIEGIEEIRLKSHGGRFLDTEVLVNANIRIPGSRTHNVTPRTPVIHLGDGCLTEGSIGQCLGEPIVKAGPDLAQHP